MSDNFFDAERFSNEPTEDLENDLEETLDITLELVEELKDFRTTLTGFLKNLEIKVNYELQLMEKEPGKISINYKEMAEEWKKFQVEFEDLHIDFSRIIICYENDRELRKCPVRVCEELSKRANNK